MAFIKPILKLTAVFAIICASSVYAQDAYDQNGADPPTRAAQLSYSNGVVSMQPAGINDWAPVEINRPFSTGDYLYTDQKSIAELRLDSAVFRMGEVTSFGFLNLNDQIAQLKLTEGDLYFRVHNLEPGQVYEIDTPNAAISLMRDGVYRVHVDPNMNTTFLVVREGQAQVTGGGQAFTLNPEQSANLSGTDQLAFDIEQAPAPDALDNWSIERDRRAMQASATRYVPPSMVGYEDLDQYGSWTQAPDYGPVWYPTHVDPGWAPYHEGHWVWVEPWGWTWVDAQPWGFAPCHYGRWVYGHNRWGWAPGPVVVVASRPVRPIYAPAVVAWFGGAHWGVSVALGGGPSLGWVPLGYGEIYTPHYHCSPTYFQHVNVYNTRVVNTVNITNVYKTVYVQHNVYQQTFANGRAPHGVESMPSSAFASGRPVQQAGRPVEAAQFARMRDAQVVAPGVVPSRMAVAPGLGQNAPHPNQAFFSRQVIARTAAPGQVASFAARQAYLQQHVGQPHDFAAMHQAVQAQVRPVAEFRQVPQGRPAEVHVGQHFGNAPPGPVARTGNPSQLEGQRPIQQPASQARYNQPNSGRNNQFHPNEAQPGENRRQPEQGNRPAEHGLPPNMRGGNSGQNANTQQPRNYPESNELRPNGRPASSQAQTEPRYQAAPHQNAPAENAHRSEANQPQAAPRASEAPRPQVARTPEHEHLQESHSNNRAAEHSNSAEHSNAGEHNHAAEHNGSGEHNSGGHSESHGSEHHDDKNGDHK